MFSILQMNLRLRESCSFLKYIQLEKSELRLEPGLLISKIY